jgi:large subunit ribosomal protein L15
MNLNSINVKIKKPKKRVGRGIGSGKGKTSGRGHKGQKSRSGVAIKSFEGGQMPLYRRLPKRGFKSLKNKKNIATLNLSIMQNVITKNNLSPNEIINLSMLQKANLIDKKYNKIKILGVGDLKEKFSFEVNFISASAKKKIEKLGGKVSLIK